MKRSDNTGCPFAELSANLLVPVYGSGEFCHASSREPLRQFWWKLLAFVLRKLRECGCFGEEPMTEVLFYHLTEHSLEQALPGLLERCLERDWKVVVQMSGQDRLEFLDRHLWTYRADSFLPHGAKDAGAGNEEPEEGGKHPVWLTTTTENPNGATVRFQIDGAIPGPVDAYNRVIYMFDGHNGEAVAHARERWKIEKAAGHDLTYWQQDEEGRWSKKA